MHNILYRVSRRALLPALGLALTIGAAGLTTSAADAEPNNAGSGAKVTCTYANLDYSVGAKVYIGRTKSGNPIFQVCQADGTWKRVELPPAFPDLQWHSGGVFAQP